MQPDSGVPTTVGAYTLLTRLGEGGMGIVHLARGPDGRRVALKVLRPQIVGDEEARARLAREVSSLTRIRSPWVAEMIEADPWAEVPYVVTRYVPGYSLHDHVTHEGTVEGRDLHWFAGCLAEGLAAVHSVGVLHRDVKPGNVLMEGRTPILIDFGLARVAEDPRLTHTGWLLGTPGYLAPEILYGDDATPAADVHAWAATVAYAATGRAPYGRGPAMAIMDRTRRGQHDLTGIEQPLADVLAAALDPDPLERPLLEEVLRWLRPLSTQPQLSPVAPPTGLFPSTPTPTDDDLTLPLAIVHDGSVAPAPATPRTIETTPSPTPPPPPPTRALPTEMAPYAAPAPPSSGPPPGPLPPPAPEAMARIEEAWDQAWGPPVDPAATPVRPPMAERIRRWVAVGLGAVALGTGFAAAPWVASVVVVVAVWLLRAGSLAASAAAMRRTLRGTKWYDGPRLVVTSPWHLVRAITGTVVLVLWSAGLGVAAGLICYALALDVPSTLLACGTTLGVALWSGPGAHRFRSPISRALDPASRRVLPWLFVCAGLLGAAVALGVLVAGQGVSWTPWSEGPFGL